MVKKQSSVIDRSVLCDGGIRCSVCDSTGAKCMDERDGCTLYSCHRCELQFWHPLQETNSDYYENDFRYSIRDELMPEKLGQRHHVFLKSNTLVGGTLLDVGCGTGLLLDRCRSKGYKVVGIDFDVNAIATARSFRGIEEVYAVSLDEYRRRNPDKRFNVITLFEVLEHQADPRGFVMAVKGMLTDNGYIAISVPNRDRWDKVPFPDDYPPNHLTKWNHKALANFMSSCGFSIVDIRIGHLTLYSARQVLTGWLNSVKDQVLLKGLQMTRHGRSGSSKNRYMRRVFSVTFALWRMLTFLPSFFIMLYSRVRSKQGTLLYCLARVNSAFDGV